MSYDCGHCGKRSWAAPEANRCGCCNQPLCDCDLPCPAFGKLEARVAELEAMMKYLDDRLNIPGLKEREARIA